MCNWVVDSSVFSCFMGRYSAALKSVLKGGRKQGGLGVTCKEHTLSDTHTHTPTHMHARIDNTCAPVGVWKHGGEGSTSLIAPLIKKPVARRSTPIVS